MVSDHVLTRSVLFTGAFCDLSQTDGTTNLSAHGGSTHSQESPDASKHVTGTISKVVDRTGDLMAGLPLFFLFFSLGLYPGQQLLSVSQTWKKSTQSKLSRWDSCIWKPNDLLLFKLDKNKIRHNEGLCHISVAKTRDTYFFTWQQTFRNVWRCELRFKHNIE